MNDLSVMDVQEHFVKLGNKNVVKEIDILLDHVEVLKARHKDYIIQIEKFLLNFNIFNFSLDPWDVTLIFEGDFTENEQLADNMGLDYYKEYDFEGDDIGKIEMPLEYMRSILHSWYEYNNKLDIAQMRLM